MSDSARSNQALLVNPFRLGISPQDAIPDGAWGQALNTALAMLMIGPGLIVVLGPAGVGKTLLLMELQRRLEECGKDVALIRQGMDQLAGGDNAAIFNQPPDRILLVDEVRSDASVVQALSGLEQRHCLIVAAPGLEAEISGLRHQPAIIRLCSLSPVAAHNFVLERLRQAGRPATLLSSQAMQVLVDETNGIPRLLCAVGGGALYLAATDDANQVSDAHVIQALEFAGFDRAEVATEPSAVAPVTLLAPPVFCPPKTSRALSARRDEQLETPLSGARRSRIPVWAGLFLLFLVAAAALAPDPVDRPVQSPDVVDAATSPGATDSHLPPTQEPAVATSVPTASPDPGIVLPAQPNLAFTNARAATGQLKTAAARLVISFPRGDAVMAGQAALLARSLVRAGFVVGTPVPAPGSLGNSSLRVFYPQDQPAAALLRDAFGDTKLSVRQAQSGSRLSLPRPGTIEISLAGSTSPERWTQAVEGGAPIAAPISAPQLALDSPMPTDGSIISVGPTRQIRLSWKPSRETGTTRFVEVHEQGSRSAPEVFAGFVEENTILIDVGTLGAAYAWRVFTIRPEAMHYVQSKWYRFDVEPRVNAAR